MDPESQKPRKRIDLPGRADENERESRGEVRTHFQIISKGTLTVWLSVPRRRRDSLGPLVNKIKSPYCLEGEEAPFLFSVLCHSMSCVFWTEVPDSERHDSSFSTVSLRVTAMSPHHTSPNDLSRKKKQEKKKRNSTASPVGA